MSANVSRNSSDYYMSQTRRCVADLLMLVPSSALLVHVSSDRSYTITLSDSGLPPIPWPVVACPPVQAGDAHHSLRRGFRLHDKDPLHPGASPYIAKWQMGTLPGCCGVLLSNDHRTTLSWRGKGLGKAFLKLKIALAEQWGYSVLMLTEIQSSRYYKFLKEQGFEECYAFTNVRSMNDVGVLALSLEETCYKPE